jgi:ATP-binding cassette subfamily B (MDR/TAP) protein 1
MFVIAILSTAAIAFQNYLFEGAAATLTARLRSLSFKAMLRQDSKTVQHREQPKI